MQHRDDIVPVPDVGGRILHMRKKKGLTQVELANALADVGWEKPSEVLIYKLEQNIRRLDAHELCLLATALKCKITDLVALTKS